MKFTAVGDMIIGRRIAEDFEGFSEITPFIMQGDARFFNLETTLNYEGECPSSQLSGGTYLRVVPEVLDDIKNFGFNMTSFNNNHALDFSYEGLVCTLDSVNESGLVHAGVGMNLAEASAPRYLETKNGRVALISVNTTFDEYMLAGAQTPRIPGRPGINGLRTETTVVVEKEDIVRIKEIAKKTGINAYNDIIRKEGYLSELPDDMAELGKMRFIAGDRPECKVTLNKTDMARIEKAIYEAKLQADYIIVSIHSHELSGDKKETPSEFLKEFAHRVIDCGAHAVVGHGPHLLRPIEIYNDRPIFYSLGDFALQLYNVETAPEEFFSKYGLSAATATVHELLKIRSDNFSRGLMEDRRMFMAVIPFWEMEDGRLTSLRLMPIEMKMNGHKSEIGLPRRSDGKDIEKYLGEMCKEYGTKVKLDSDGIITVTW